MLYKFGIIIIIIIMEKLLTGTLILTKNPLLLLHALTSSFIFIGQAVLVVARGFLSVVMNLDTNSWNSTLGRN